MSQRPLPVRRPSTPVVLAAVTALVAAMMSVLAFTAAASADDTVTYTHTETIPVPPASTYAGSGGGDGWAVALSSGEVFNVFHHDGGLQVACHEQSDASPCYDIRTVTQGSHGFGTSGHPGLYLDQATGRLYVYATRDDGTAGVVCVDTTTAATDPDPICGFTALTPVGDAYFPGISNLSDVLATGGKLYAFNYYPGSGATGARNAMLCFDLSTHAACSGQPYAIAFHSTTFDPYWFPEPQVALIGGFVIVSNHGDAGDELSCFDPATHATCGGSWPVAAPGGYTGAYGAPFPLLSVAGSLRGFCLPTGSDPCYDLSGASVATPAGLPAAVPGSDGWNGPAFVIGSRVYVANGNYENEVFCYNAATDAECSNFPKSFDNLGFIYTVNPDQQRPTCAWVNADNGSEQIQNFDVFTGGACGQGPIRVLASSFVVNAPECTPGSFTSLRIDAPPPSSYTSGSVSFLDSDGNPIPGASDRPLDATGTVDLTGLDLTGSGGLPQFLITLVGAGAPSAVTITLTWMGTHDPACDPNGGGDTTPPVVDAGPAVSGPVNTALALHGTATDASPLTTTWSLPSGAPCTIADPSALVTTVTCTAPGDYTLTLSASDGTNTASDTTVVHVRPVTSGGVTCDGFPATIVGTWHDDVITGTPGRDVIVGGRGNDRINGLGGNDVICAGQGNDIVNAGPGNDYVDGGAGNDRIFGGTGNDQLIGGRDNDLIHGGDGNDTINANRGDDRIGAGMGDDTVFGDGGNDRLVGGSGTNTLNGGAGLDVCGLPTDGPDTLLGCEVNRT